jgi:galactoside O-acetyltransferase
MPEAIHRGRSYRPLELGKDGERASNRLIWWLDTHLRHPKTDRYGLCRSFLISVWRGKAAAEYEALLNDENLTSSARAQIASFDARNITLEAEAYKECDAEKFNRVKPLLWMWQMFDHSPLGRNVDLGPRVRRVLAPYIFKKCGEDVKFFHEVEFSFGYNLTIGSGSVIHRNVLLDDRGEIIIGDNVSIGDHSNIYSHDHHTLDYHNISLGRTVLENDVRLDHHATIMSGVKIGEDATVGACAVVTKDVPPHHVVGGNPANTITVKKR